MAVALPPEQNVERIFKNGLRNPKFDPVAMKGYNPTIYKSRLNISNLNPTGAFPPILSEDFVVNYFNVLQKLDSNRFGRSSEIFLQDAAIIPTNITHNDQMFKRVVIISAQNFVFDVPPNPRRHLTPAELDALPIKTIGAENSDTIVVAPPGETCTNCRNTFAIGAEVIQLKCGHIFYDDCIKDWLGTSGDCPNCDRLVREADFEGASVRIRAFGPPSGGVLGLKNTLLNSLGDDIIIGAALKEFANLSKAGKTFSAMESINFCVLPFTSNKED